MSQQDQNPVQKQPKSGGRRRFLGAGAAAAPAVLTLVSQPALGTGVTCFSPSRSLSRNTSVSQQGKYGECRNAQSPGNYKAQQSGGSSYSWPSTVPPTTPFHPTFSGSRFTTGSGSSYRSLTMGEVLNLNGGSLDSEKVAFHLIGAYLNAKGGNGAVIPQNVITADEITVIWHEYSTRGYFEPTAGVKWYGAEIKYYLISNGIVK